jgi:hypothetical protein
MPARCSVRGFVATLAAVVAGCALGVGPATAASPGILPPANPAADCDPQGSHPGFTLQELNGCRAKENLGPLTLPSNWTSLNAPEQMLVLIDLERVNRGLPAVIGLSPALDQLATHGAQVGDDPAFPSGGFQGGGGIWFGGDSTVAADYVWMYDDGPRGLDINEDCPATGSSGCWLHRDIILWKGTGGELVGGGGATDGSYAFEVLSGYSSAGLTFTWSHELRYFASRPGLDPLNPLARKASGGAQHHKARKHDGHRRRGRHHTHGAKPGGKGGSAGPTDTITITFG